MSYDYLTINQVNELQQCQSEEDDRFRLWSSCELMRRFSASHFGLAMSALGRTTHYIELAKHSMDEDEIRAVLAGIIARDIITVFSSIPLSLTLQKQLERLQNIVPDKIYSLDVIRDRLAEFGNNVAVELTSPRFYMIPADRSIYYEKPQQAFGQVACDYYSDAKRDIEGAGRCFALDQWTACVFHLMRVLEHGLRDLNQRLGLPDGDQENWKNILDRAVKAITAMEQLPKTHQRDDDIHFYSHAASNFRLFKDAWRNYVSHSHTDYDEREAIQVWNSVSQFMNEMAKPRA
jgi:hypothetical protein